MSAFGSVSDWVLRRFLKVFFLKRMTNFFLKNELDLHQLELQLNQGALELRDCLIDTDYLNSQLNNNAFEIESALIGRINIALFPPRIVVDDVVVTLQQRKGSNNNAGKAPAAASASPAANASDMADQARYMQDMAGTAVNEGVRLISASVQSLLKKVQFEGMNLVLRVQFAKGHVLAVNVDKAMICDALDAKNRSSFTWDTAKTCSFAGLAVQLASSTAADSAVVLASISGSETSGCDGEVTLAWSKGDLEKGENASASVEIGCSVGASVCFSPPALPAIIAILESDVTSSASTLEVLPAAGSSEHPMSKSFLVAEATSSENIVKALMLPNGERLLGQELAQQANPDTPRLEDEVDEFFDAVSEIMSQSFYSTASSIYHDTDAHHVGDSFLSGFSEATSEEEESPSLFMSVQVEFALPVLDVWLVPSLSGKKVAENSSELLLYLRMNMRGISLRNEACGASTMLRATFHCLEISEYAPMDRQGLRDTSTCTAFVNSLGKDASKDWFQEKAPFAKTIERLERLKRLDPSGWCPPEHYTMTPVMAVTAREQPAFGLSFVKEESASTVNLLVQEVYVWVDVPFLARLQSFLSLFQAASSNSAPPPPPPGFKSFEANIYASSLSMCCFVPPGRAIALQVSSAINMSRIFADFIRGDISSMKTINDPAICLVRGKPEPFLHLQTCTAYILLATLNDSEGSTVSSFDITEVGSAKEMSVLCKFNWSSTYIDDLSLSLPRNMADLLSSYGSICEGMDLEIAGELEIKMSSDSMASLSALGNSLSMISSTPSKSGIKVHVDKLGVSTLTDSGAKVTFEFNGLQCVRVTDDESTAAVVASVGFLSGFDDRGVFLTSAVGGSSPITFGCSQTNVLTSGGSGSVALIHIEGIVFKEDMYSAQHRWTDLPVVRALSTETGTAPPSDIEVAGKNVALVHEPSEIESGTVRVGAVFSLKDFSAAWRSQDEMEAVLNGISIHLWQGNVAPPILPSGTRDSIAGCILLASEEKLCYKHNTITSSSSSEPESRNATLTSEHLHVSLNKESAVMLRSLLQRGGTQADANLIPDESVPDKTRQDVKIQQALALDIRSSSAEPENDDDVTDSSPDGDWVDACTRPATRATSPETAYEDAFVSSAEEEGNGALLLEDMRVSELVIDDYVVEPREFDSFEGVDRSDHTLDVAMRFKSRQISLNLTDTLSPSKEVLEGSFEVYFENLDVSASHYSSTSGAMVHYLCALGRIRMRHDIHPQAAPSTPWQEVLTSPHMLGKSSPSPIRISALSSSPQNAEGLQWRVRTRFAPTVVKLDQHCVEFLSEFSSFVNLDAWQFVDEDEEEEEEEDFAESQFVERCHLDGFAVNVSYRPCRFDMGALRKGNRMEMLNVLPEWKATLWLRELKVSGVESFSTLGTVATASWLKDIRAHQMHKFFITVPGVQFTRRLGSAAREVISLPKTASKKEFRMQLRRACVTFASEIGAVLSEAVRSSSTKTR